MSSELFRIEVLEIAGTSVLVEVTDTHHAISPPDTETFFFAALHEPASEGEHPLAQACSVEQMCDEDFVETNLRQYVARVEVVEVGSAVTAKYRVHVTDPKWLVQLRPGLAWGTASYDIGDPVLRPALEALGRQPATPKRGVD